MATGRPTANILTDNGLTGIAEREAFVIRDNLVIGCQYLSYRCNHERIKRAKGMITEIVMMSIAVLCAAFHFIKPVVINKWHWFWLKYHNDKVRAMGDTGWTLAYNHHSLRCLYHLDKI